MISGGLCCSIEAAEIGGIGEISGMAFVNWNVGVLSNDGVWARIRYD